MVMVNEYILQFTYSSRSLFFSFAFAMVSCFLLYSRLRSSYHVKNSISHFTSSVFFVQNHMCLSCPRSIATKVWRTLTLLSFGAKIIAFLFCNILSLFCFLLYIFVADRFFDQFKAGWFIFIYQCGPHGFEIFYFGMTFFDSLRL